jgi:ABC-type branched-subunit amino acid transport system substrate-binding protein
VDELVFDDEVDIISGIIGSANNLAVQDDLNAQCIPHLWASTGASNWGEIDTYPWSSGLLVSYTVESQVWADFASSQGAETAALFYVNSEFGQAYADAFKEAAAEVGIEIVAEETIDTADSGAPSGQMTNLAEANPDTILAVPLGAQCIAFMTELGNAQAANADFDPLVYQTATCANALFFASVGNGGSDGVYTSSNIKDLASPEVRESDPAVNAYVDGLAAIGSEVDPSNTSAAAGWLAMELAVNNLFTASEAGNLSRQGVIDAVRNIDYQAEISREGCRSIMNAEDGFIGECTQVQSWDADAGVFVDEGELYDLEGEMGVAS